MSENTKTTMPRRGPLGGRGPGGGMMPGEKAKDFKGTIGRLLNYMGRYKIALLFIAIFACGSAAFSVVGPKIMGNATTEIFNGLVAKIGGTGGIDFGRIAQILLALLAIYLISAVFSFVQSWLMTGISQRMAYRMRSDISEKINRMPMKYFESRTVGEVLSRITNDVDTMGQSLNQSVTQLISSVTTLIGVVVMMLTISPVMTLIAFVILPVSMLFIGVVVKHSQKYFQDQQKYLGVINGQVEEVYSGHSVVKAFNREGAVEAEFDSTNKVLFSSAWKSQFLSGMMQPIMTFVGNLGYVAVAISGSVLAVRGVITVGDIQAFIQYVRSFTQPITQMSQVFNMLQSMAAAAERVFEFLGEEEENLKGSAPDQIDEARRAAGEVLPVRVHEEGQEPWRTPAVGKLEGAVRFDHVRFGYDPEKIIINDFSAAVEPGKMVAIVGPTGAGKTTMVKLLMRFYDVNGGAITVDGHDVREFDRSELRGAFGMVLQDTWLFKGTIMENIRYGRLDAADEEVYAAARAAHVHHFIQTLPGGYRMELNEDATNISQGQKQLLTIARAILADNRILILDEATSSVDTRTEHLIQAAMANLMKGRTSFVIAHRLSTIKDADLILVMKDGDIIEQGSHKDLLERGGFYAELYNSQFEDVES
ncbi:MAG TPA: ABC transporter ATP-binding protein [Pseudoflavonifractor sp.]|nr:ABC transporter ATP-binding protein [Pseudoflavonifractor sp.]